jgi:hypothetical protein
MVALRGYGESLLVLFALSLPCFTQCVNQEILLQQLLIQTLLPQSVAGNVDKNGKLTKDNTISK